MDARESALTRGAEKLEEVTEGVGGGSGIAGQQSQVFDLEAEVRAIHEVHSQSLIAFARMFSGSGETAEEALQEAYHRYLTTRSQGTEIVNPRAWLLRVIHNLILDWKKLASRSRELKADDYEAPQLDPVEEDNLKQLRKILGMTKGILSPREQEVLDLRLKGLSYADVASVLGIGIGSVSSHLSRGLNKLRRVRWSGE